MMRFHVGTSGYSYKEWRGSFYPDKLSPDEMLGYYARRFATVEINSTFYRIPEKQVIKSWAGQVPDEFTFAMKSPQIITHRKRLKSVATELRQFMDLAAGLGAKRGPLLFGLPPNFKKDVPRLEAFLDELGDKTPAAMEFRHESWLDDEVFDCLRARSCALCIADVDESPSPKVVSTAGWGYVRLRRADYTDRQLRAWIGKIRGQPWSAVYVYFKHEETGSGPRLAERFLALAQKGSRSSRTFQ